MSDTTVAEICEEADIATKTFFNHYSTKEALIEELCLEAAGSQALLVNRILESDSSTTDRFRMIFEATVKDIEERGEMHPEYLLRIFAVKDETGRLAAWRYRDGFFAILSEGVTRGDVDPDIGLETVTDRKSTL